MADKKVLYRNYAPFGIRTERGAKLGIHPSLDKTGGNTRIPITDVGPGSYDAKFPECKHKNGFSWSRKLKIEEFSKMMGYKNLAVLENRQFYKSLRGPGTHEIDPALFHPKFSSVFEDVSFTRGKRWSYQNGPNTPSPDRYFYDLDKISTTIKKSFSQTRSFEYDGFVDRFRISEPPRYLLPSNLYNVTEHDGKAIADIFKKRISIRGPYDLFTGPRDGSTLYGFSSQRDFTIPDWFFVKPSMVDIMLHTKNRSRTGKFLKEERFTKKPTKRHMLNDLALCYRDPNEPGPATYDMTKYKGIVAQPPSIYPFNTSKAQARLPPGGKAKIFPGPGRYSPKVIKCMKQKRASWVFLSKIPRKFYEEYDYRSF